MNKIIMVMVLLIPSFATEAHTGVVHIGGLLDGVVHFFTSADHLLILLVGVFGVFKIFSIVVSHLSSEKINID